jgi:hypothetical protein
MDILNNSLKKKNIALKIFLPNVFKAIENLLLDLINTENKFKFSIDNINYDSSDITINSVKILSYILFIDIINEDYIDGIKKIIYNHYINLLIGKKMSIENIVFYFDNIWISHNHLINFLEEYIRINLDTDAYIVHLQYRLLINIHNLSKKYNTFLNKLYNINNNIFRNNNFIFNIQYRIIETDFNEFIEKKKKKHAANILLSFNNKI